MKPSSTCLDRGRQGPSSEGDVTSRITPTCVPTAGVWEPPLPLLVRFLSWVVASASLCASAVGLEPPSIQESPGDAVVVAGQPASFQVVAGGGELFFQWQHNQRPIRGATNEHFTLAAVQPAQAGAYSVRVYNAAGQVISQEANLQVNVAPTLLRAPSDQTVAQGAGITWSVLVEGSPPFSYQWYRNGNPVDGATKAELRLANLRPEDAGTFTVNIRNSAGAVTTPSAQLSVLVPPTVLTAPTNSEFLLGATARFSVTAQGTPPLSYQWYRNGEPVPQADRPVLEIPAVRLEDEGTYAVSVTNPGGRQLTPAARLTVLYYPRVLASPTDLVVGISNRATFRVEGAGSGPITYIWRQNGLRLLADPTYVGVDRSTLVLPNVGLDQAGLYDVIVCNTVGAVTSRVARLSVGLPPTIEKQPQGGVYGFMEEFGLSVEASGSEPLSYQWQFNGKAIPGATNRGFGPELMLDETAGAYSVIVRNPFGIAVSEPASVTLDNILSPPSDSFTTATEVCFPFDCNYLRGSTLGFTREPGEPRHAGAIGRASGWYRWRATEDAVVSIETTGSTFDTLLAVYVRNESGNVVPVASNEDLPGVLTSRVRFQATTGTMYYIAVDGFDGDMGDFALAVGIMRSSGTLSATPRILTPPASGSGPPGRSTNLVVRAEGSNLSYQWYFLGAPLRGETNSLLSLPNIQAQNVGTYFARVFAANRSLFVDSPSAVIEIGPADGVVSQDKRYVRITDGGASDGGENPGAVPPRPSLADGSTSAGTIVVRPGVSIGQTLNNLTSTLSSSDPRNCNWVGGATRWITNLVVEQKGVLIIDSRESEVQALTGLFTYFSAQLKLLTCAADGLLIYTNQTPGAVYDLMADSVQGQGGIITLRISLIQPPELASLTSAPRFLQINEPVVLEAGLLNNPVPAPTYQWYLNETNLLADATNRSYQLRGYQAADAGAYSVRIGSILGELTNQVATLRTRQPATWSLEPLGAVLNGGSPGPLWARDLEEAYLWVNGGQTGFTAASEARLFRQHEGVWEMILRLPGWRGTVVQGAGSTDLAAWLQRTDSPSLQSLFLTSADSGTTWTTNTLPPAAQRAPARVIAGGATDRQVLFTDGTLLRQKGPTWTTLQSASINPMLDLTLLPGPSGFAITAKTLLKWNGTRWGESITAPAGYDCQRLLAFAEETNRHALVLLRNVANGEFRFWDATVASAPLAPEVVRALETPLDSRQLAEVVGVWGNTLGHLFVAGKRPNADPVRAAGTLLHFDGRSWHRITELGTIPGPLALSGAGTEEVWVALSDGRLARRQTLKPGSPPMITVTGVAEPLVSGSPVLLHSTVLGTGPFSYQWRRDGRPLPGETNDQLEIPSLTLQTAGRYSLTITTAFGQAEAETDLTNLRFPPSVTSAAQELSVYAGMTAAFTVEAKGDAPLRYQWFSAAGPLTGETSPTLVLAGVQVRDAGEYWMEVSNAYGLTASPRSVLGVTPGIRLQSTLPSTPHQLQGVADSPFVVEWSADLNTWIPWFTNQILRFPAPFDLNDPDTEGFPRKFYRVKAW